MKKSQKYDMLDEITVKEIKAIDKRLKTCTDDIEYIQLILDRWSLYDEHVMGRVKKLADDLSINLYTPHEFAKDYEKLCYQYQDADLFLTVSRLTDYLYYLSYGKGEESAKSLKQECDLAEVWDELIHDPHVVKYQGFIDQKTQEAKEFMTEKELKLYQIMRRDYMEMAQTCWSVFFLLGYMETVEQPENKSLKSGLAKQVQNYFYQQKG